MGSKDSICIPEVKQWRTSSSSKSSTCAGSEGQPINAAAARGMEGALIGGIAKPAYLDFLRSLSGQTRGWHKISARTIGDRLKVRTPAYSFDEVSHIAQSCRALASVRIVLSLLVHVSTLWVRMRGRQKLKQPVYYDSLLCLELQRPVGRRK